MKKLQIFSFISLFIFLSHSVFINSAATINNESDDAFLTAIKVGDTASVKILIDNGANVNAIFKEVVSPFLTETHPALVLASYHGYADIVRLLLSRGANIDAIDNLNWTALIHASIKNKKDIVCLLLDNGANINAAPVGYTALIRATLEGNKDIVQLLINYGAHVNAVTNCGDTALMLAAENGHKEIVELLLNAGANLDNQNKIGIGGGQTAIDLAKKSRTFDSEETKKNKVEIVKLLNSEPLRRKAILELRRDMLEAQTKLPREIIGTIESYISNEFIDLDAINAYRLVINKEIQNKTSLPRVLLAIIDTYRTDNN